MLRSKYSEWQQATQLVPCEIKPETLHGVEGFWVKQDGETTWHKNTPKFNQQYFQNIGAAVFGMNETLKATWNSKDMGSVDEALTYYHFSADAQVSNASKRVSVEIAQKCFPFMFLQCFDLSVSAEVDPGVTPVAQRLLYKAENKEGQKVY